MNCLVDQAEIHKLVESEEVNDRKRAASSLGSDFCYVSNKITAWQDLQRLTQDADISVRRDAAEALGSAFLHIPNKEQAWQDLLRLTRDNDEEVRRGAASALGSAFPHIPDKEQAWQDLHGLTQDADVSVRREAAEALWSIFAHIPDKNQALQDLVKLTQDKHSKVRVYAYNSLGRASVLKATEAEDIDIMKNELEAAVAYFEKSSKEESLKNPAEFCLPFYRSYFAITFRDANEDEIKRYIAEAKKAVGDSKSKEKLLEAVENLAKALQESQKLKNISINEIASAQLKNKSVDEIKNELYAYRWYCEEAAKHMAAAEEGAPGAVKLMRRCNPLLEERIQVTIDEIQRTARQICQSFRGSGTEYETLGTEIHKAARALTTDDIVHMQKCSSRIVKQLQKFCKLLPEGEKSSVCEVIKEIEHEAEFPERLHKIELALSYLRPVLEDQKLSYERCININKNLSETTFLSEKLFDNETIHGSSDNWRQYDVFFSYNSADRNEVIAIGDMLKKHDIKPWIDIWELRPGQSLSDFDKQLSKIKSVAVFVGKEGIGPWQNFETRALLGEFAKNKRPIIPILLKSATVDPELPIFMKNLAWIDFRKDDPDPYEQLVWGIKGEKIQ